MPYLFTCSHCQTKTLVEDRYSGLSGQCVTCGKPITIPEFASTAAEKRPGADAVNNVRPGHRVGRIATAIVAVTLAIGVLVVVIQLGQDAVTRVQAGRIRSGSLKNLEQIADALRSYAAAHGRFPPPVSRDDSGTPLHSWRVLVLPYLGHEDLYFQFDLDRPWDAMENQEAALEMPSVYRHPTSQRGQTPYGMGGSPIAGYYLITGPETLFPPTGPLREDQVHDGAAKTLLVVEATPVGASSWTEPVDLKLASLQGAVNSGGDSAAGGLSEGGVAVATVNGQGQFVPERCTPRTFRSLVTPAGNEPTADDVFE